MNRLLALCGFVLILAVVLAIWFSMQSRQSTQMSLSEAVVIARSSATECVTKGEVSATGTYNENSDTWWIDFRPSAQYAQPGCNPACVVSAGSGTVEINWRCTGALPSDEFSADGNVVRNNPGLKPDVWYLIYEMPGAAARTLELDLNAVTAPHIDLSQGQRVHITGQLDGDVVRVRTIGSASTETGQRITLYYYDPARDQGPGGVQCTAKGLVGVERVIPQTSTPLTDAIRLLLRGELSEEEKVRGITTDFPLDGVSLSGVSIVNGVAILTFSDPQNKTGGGSCRVAVLWAQIAATAKQFPTVTSVQFKPDSLFQP